MADPGWMCTNCKTWNEVSLDACRSCGRVRLPGAGPTVQPSSGIDGRSVLEIDDRHRLVAYVSVDSPDVVSEFNFALAADLALLSSEGWRVVSVSVYPLRAGGTMGSFLSQGGGNYTTVLGATAILERVPPA